MGKRNINLDLKRILMNKLLQMIKK